MRSRAVVSAPAGVLTRALACVLRPQDVASSAYFLPKYDARAGSSLAASLRERLGAAEAAGAPRRKFSFAARKAPAAPPAPPAPATENPAVPSLAACVPEAPHEQELGPCLQKAAPGSFTLLTQQHLGGPHADFTVQDCTGAHYRMIMPPSVLQTPLKRATEYVCALPASSLRLHGSDPGLSARAARAPTVARASACSGGGRRSVRRVLHGLRVAHGKRASPSARHVRHAALSGALLTPSFPDAMKVTTSHFSFL